MAILMSSALVATTIVAVATEARELGQGLVPDPLPPVGPRIYHSFQFPNDRLPVIDGDLTDWEIVGDRYQQHTFQLLNQRGSDPSIRRAYDPTDFDIRVRTGYHPRSNRIYVAAEYYDDFHNLDRVMDSHLQVGHDDLFELVIDADRSGGDFVRPLRLRNTHAQNYHTYFHEREGNHHWVWGEQLWLGEAPYGESASIFNGVHGSAGKAVLEFYVTPFNYAHEDGPHLSALAELAVGDTIGMSYAILDWEEDESQGAHFWALADTVLMYCNADYLADFVLEPLEEDLAALPVAEFKTRAPSLDDPRAVQFANQTEGEVESYRWDFGDGNSSTDAEPLHRYAKPGVYTVTLVATGPGGQHRKRKLNYVVLRQ